MRARPERRMYFRLAAHLGMTVGELLARVSSRELTEWQLYERMTGPLDGGRGDVHAAMVAHAVVNSQRGKKAPLALSKFLPQWEGRRALSPEELYEKVREINSELGGVEVDADGEPYPDDPPDDDPPDVHATGADRAPVDADG